MNSRGAQNGRELLLEIRHVTSQELEIFSSILREGALWLEEQGIPMWNKRQISAEQLSANYSLHELFIGFVHNEPVAAMILQQSDSLLWPEDKSHIALYLHKLCVRRAFAKQGLSNQMLHWAKARATALGKTRLRLDCAADRPKLRKLYEEAGFTKVKELLVRGTYPTVCYELHCPA